MRLKSSARNDESTLVFAIINNNNHTQPV
jgi:hypothetical protein